MVMNGRLLAAAAIAAGLAVHAPASAQVQFATSETRAVTYSSDVAAIIQQNCIVCHRPGGIGPMDLVTYEDARRYATRIRAQVSNGLMPPYAYDRNIGIQDLQGDWRLSDEEINTIVAWVDQGAALGDASAVPPRRAFPRRTSSRSRRSSDRRTSSSARRRSTCPPRATTCGTGRSFRRV